MKPLYKQDIALIPQVEKLILNACVDAIVDPTRQHQGAPIPNWISASCICDLLQQRLSVSVVLRHESSHRLAFQVATANNLRATIYFFRVADKHHPLRPAVLTSLLLMGLFNYTAIIDQPVNQASYGPVTAAAVNAEIPLPKLINRVAANLITTPNQPPNQPSNQSSNQSSKATPVQADARQETIKQQFWLRVFSSPNEKSIEKLSASMKFNYRTVSFTKRDAKWLGLELGPYKDRAEAVQAKNQLPQSLSTNRPWIIEDTVSSLPTMKNIGYQR